MAVAPIGQFPFYNFERLIAVNIKGMFVATQESVRHMRDGPHRPHRSEPNA